MRPVTRGVPAAYPADYLALTDSRAKADVASATTLQEYIDKMDTLRQRIATILSEIAVAGAEITSSKKRKKSQSNRNLADITAAQPGLEAAYHIALNTAPINEDALAKAAQDLVENLNAQIKWYSSHRGSYQARVNGVYGRARGDLIANIGQYCSYCEIPLAASLAVEHMLPKAEFPLAALSWTNFLLACSKCNSYKNAKPSRETGKQTALAAKQPPPLSTDVISAAALSTYVWPSDNAVYVSWQSFFRFRMKKVLYGSDGTLLNIADIPDSVVNSWGSGKTQVTVLSENDYAIDVQFAELLGEIKGNAAATILQGLGANTINQLLQTTLTALSLDYRLNFVNATPQLASVGNNTWRISEQWQYKVDATDQRGPKLYEGAREIATIPLPSNADQNAFLGSLHRGDIPSQIANILTAQGNYVNPLTQQVEVAHPDRSTYIITVKKTIDIVNDGGVVQLYSPQQSQVELHLAPIVSAGAAKAQQVIEDLQLNHIDPTDTRFSDRRMVKRTKTWFVAFEAARNWHEVVRVVGINSPLAGDLASLITQTAMATGYWSVWWSVFHDFLAVAVRAPLSTFLLHTQNFPGVR